MWWGQWRMKHCEWENGPHQHRQLRITTNTKRNNTIDSASLFQRTTDLFCFYYLIFTSSSLPHFNRHHISWKTKFHCILLFAEIICVHLLAFWMSANKNSVWTAFLLPDLLFLVVVVVAINVYYLYNGYTRRCLSAMHVMSVCKV